MPTSGEKIEIFTIGHSNRSLDEIIEIFKKYKIQLVADVRSSPYSRYVPQYNREKFHLSLENSGISYWYAGDHLGGRPKDQTCYKCGKIPDTKANYLDIVDYEEVAKREWYKIEIDHLISKAKIITTVIMCSEEDPNRCHRHHLIAKTLLKQKITIWHIRGKGSLEEAKLDEENKGKKQKSLLDYV
jgi:uncharacterized protein (DUF488 family)